MFELSIALKYLIPKKKQLTMTLISLMSVVVISLVVWLLLVFLSVTEGIEKNWLSKLTTLNAPIRINPTEDYFSSYYYQIDGVSSASDYSFKTIGDKKRAPFSDPYRPEQDAELPSTFPLPEQNAKDPVKQAFAILEDFQKRHRGFFYQDYEVSGALLRVQIFRGGQQSFLTQASYVATLAQHCPYLTSVIIPPSSSDINHLSQIAQYGLENNRQDTPMPSAGSPQEKFSERMKDLFAHTEIQAMKSTPTSWRIPLPLLPREASFDAIALFSGERPTHLIIPEKMNEERSLGVKGKFFRKGKDFFFQALKGKLYKLSEGVPLSTAQPLQFSQVSLNPSSLESARKLSDVKVHVETVLQNQRLAGEIPWAQIEVTQAKPHYQFSSIPSHLPPWSSVINKQIYLPKNRDGEHGVLLPKSFQDNGVCIGDHGFLSYNAMAFSSMQEQRVSIYVAGFYDPGIMSVGNRYILAPYDLAHSLYTSSSAYSMDRQLSNGIQVWCEDLAQTDRIKKELQEAFISAGIGQYWTVSTYKDYDFAKDLLQQFQSDKYLFTLVGAIILLVACCNIISLLIILVNDKKKEIGILQAMGASKKSIAYIFASCGTFMGLLSVVIGTSAAMLTLSNIGSIVSFLSMLQGHDAFNAAFYGKSLPDELSRTAVLFIAITTPVLSLAAGLIPAIKACRLQPTDVLRSE